MTNVKLSQEELRLVTDAELILTKNRIIQKVYAVFGELSEEYRQMNGQLPGEVLSNSPKISKGENYLGLPWVMLDYPRSFSTSEVFAIRSFFWWGKFFSITLLLQGTYKQQYADVIAEHLRQHADGWFICIADDQWQHHFEEQNYVTYNSGIDIYKLPFIKLAKKIPLQQWDKSYEFFIKTYCEMLSMLSTQPVK